MGRLKAHALFSLRMKFSRPRNKSISNFIDLRCRSQHVRSSCSNFPRFISYQAILQHQHPREQHQLRRLHSTSHETKIRCMKSNLSKNGGTSATVTICNASKLNSVNTNILDELYHTFQTLKQDDTLQTVILTGETSPDKPSSFCGGADIKEMSNLSNSDEAKKFIAKIHNVCQSIRSLPSIVIARIDGLVLGAGLEIGASCDFRYSTGSSIFGMPEVKLGIPSVVEARLLSNIIGWNKTRELLFFGWTYKGKEALKMGLIDSCSDTIEEMDQLISKRIEILNNNGPNAMKIQKKVINYWEENDFNSGINKSIEEFADMWKDGGSEPKKYMKLFTERKKR